MANVANILAGSKAAGTAGISLIWVAPVGTALPTSTTGVLDPAFLDAGACDPKGVTFKHNISTNPIKVFGTLATVGTLFTDKSLELDATFMETNAVAAAVHAGVELGSITVAADGSFSVVNGAPSLASYSVVVDGFSSDGSPMRYVAPKVQNAAPGDLVISQGTILTRDVGLTLLPDDSGNFLYEYYQVNGLKTAAPAWQATHAYALNAVVALGAGTAKVTTAGTSGSTSPTLPGTVGGTVTDGTVVWTRQT